MVHPERAFGASKEIVGRLLESCEHSVNNSRKIVDNFLIAVSYNARAPPKREKPLSIDKD